MAWIMCRYDSSDYDGSIVTPVSNVPIWLKCGGLSSKGYTELSQVLADSTTLNALMDSANAVNYLVRSTSWVSSITSNQSAMTSIGTHDYAAYKLTADSTWNAAICNSSYYESVLNVKVPVMTGTTTPSGEVIESAHSGSYYGWKAFDGVTGNATDMWYGASISSTLGYIFPSNVKVLKWERRNRYSTDSSAVYSPINFELWGLPDTGATWRLINSYSVNDNTSSKLFSYILDNSSGYKGYKIYVTSYNAGGSSYNSCAISNLQFYGGSFADVQTWPKVGRLNKDYTSLNQVLADSSTLQALMANTDAVNYLSACGGWASTICANQSAMNYIGLNNYASNTLLSDDTWINAILNSTYIDSVLNVKVPTMTSNTAPSGEVFYSSLYNSSYPVWQCFDNNTNTLGLVNKASNAYIGYKFTSSKKIYAIKEVSHATTAPGFSYKVQGSSSGSTYTDLSEAYQAKATTAGVVTWYPLTKNLNYYTYYRILTTNTASPDNGYGFRELQFYGRQNV